MIRHMVREMASYGGHAPATDEAAWEKMAIVIAGELKGNNAKYVMAESANGDAIGVAGAALITLGGAFAPKKTLHISAIYVLPQFRRGEHWRSVDCKNSGLGTRGRQRAV